MASRLPDLPPAHVRAPAYQLRQKAVPANAGGEYAGDCLPAGTGTDRTLSRAASAHSDPALAAARGRRVPARVVRGRRSGGAIGSQPAPHKPVGTQSDDVAA